MDRHGSSWSLLRHAALFPVLWPTVVCSVMLAFTLAALLGIYYKIDRDKLVIYTFFIPTAYPIDKIKEIKPTDSVLSAPATSLTHRLAITFTDRKFLKSNMPLIISPDHQDKFIKQLLSVNPAIEVFADK